MFEFTDSFVTCILYWVYQWVFNFSYYIQFSVLKFLFDSFDVFYFLTENFYLFYLFQECLPCISWGIFILFQNICRLFQVSLSSQSGHMWIVFSYKEISWVFECSAILDCILDIFNVLRLWVLFESYLCFSRQLVCLGSGYKFWPAFCGSWFQYQSHFQSLLLFDFDLKKLLSGQFGTWAMVHQSWVLKNVVCCWGPSRCICSSEVAKDLWTTLWSYFAKPLALHGLCSTF